MAESNEVHRRRRRRPAARPEAGPESPPAGARGAPGRGGDEPADIPACRTAGTAPAKSAGPAEPARRRSREAGERGLRDLVGGGKSQLGVSGALRARDVNRPTEDDLAEAERDTVIVRRNWRPDAAPTPAQISPASPRGR